MKATLFSVIVTSSLFLTSLVFPPVCLFFLSFLLGNIFLVFTVFRAQFD